MSRQFLTCLVLVALVAPTRADDDPGRGQTIKYVQKLQTSTGGFLAQAPAPNIKIAPTLRATSSGVRTLHYLGGELPNKDGAVKFVTSCWNDAEGGFADMPKGKPDVFTTAVGLMAVVELKMPVEKYAPAAIKFMTANAKGFEEVRIVAAGLESIKSKSDKNKDWLDMIDKMKAKDGAFGEGAGQARDTGGAAVAVLRLGGTLPDKALILKVLNEGQRLNGGYGKADNEIASDLETTYRVMRCYMMLKAEPKRVEAVRTFIAKCRNEDGGYGVAPGQMSGLSGTYFAAIVRHWLDHKAN